MAATAHGILNEEKEALRVPLVRCDRIVDEDLQVETLLRLRLVLRLDCTKTTPA